MSAPAALAPGLARKVKKVLSIQTDSPDFLEALGTLSGLYESNTASNRRRLRAIIEKNSVAINLEFLDQAKGVDTVRLSLRMICLRALSSAKAPVAAR